MDRHKFVIHAPLDRGKRSIELDGVRMKGVSRVSFDLTARGVPTLRLEISGEVLIDGEFQDSAILAIADRARAS